MSDIRRRRWCPSQGCRFRPADRPGPFGHRAAPGHRPSPAVPQVLLPPCAYVLPPCGCVSALERSRCAATARETLPAERPWLPARSARRLQPWPRRQLPSPALGQKRRALERSRCAATAHETLPAERPWLPARSARRLQPWPRRQLPSPALGQKRRALERSRCAATAHETLPAERPWLPARSARRLQPWPRRQLPSPALGQKRPPAPGQKRRRN